MYTNVFMYVSMNVWGCMGAAVWGPYGYIWGCLGLDTCVYVFAWTCIGHMYMHIYIRHRALCRVRGNEASELGTHSILLFDGLPNFTDLIQVCTYLEDCFISINTY